MFQQLPHISAGEPLTPTDFFVHQALNFNTQVQTTMSGKFKIITCQKNQLVFLMGMFCFASIFELQHTGTNDNVVWFKKFKTITCQKKQLVFLMGMFCFALHYLEENKVITHQNPLKIQIQKPSKKQGCSRFKTFEKRRLLKIQNLQKRWLLKIQSLVRKNVRKNVKRYVRKKLSEDMSERMSERISKGMSETMSA